MFLVTLALAVCLSTAFRTHGIKGSHRGKSKGGSHAHGLEGCTSMCYWNTTGECQHPGEHNEICFEKKMIEGTLQCSAGSIECGYKPSYLDPPVYAPVPSSSPSMSPTPSVSPVPSTSPAPKLLLTDNMYKFDQAQSWCQSHNRNLLIVDSQPLQNEAYELCVSSTYCWTATYRAAFGSSDVDFYNAPNATALGSYTNWDLHYPLSGWAEEEAVLIGANAGKWILQAKSYKYFGICGPVA